MKKLLTIILAMIMVLGTAVSAYAVSVDEIVDGINNHPTLKSYAEYGSVWVASKSAKGMDIDIDVEANKEHYDVDFVLDGDILSLEAAGETAFTAAAAATYVIDIIETALGYEENEYIMMMNSGDLSDFTVEKDGIEMSQDEAGNFKLKININKKATAIDLSNIYVSKEDIESYGIFDEQGSMQLNKGYIHFYRECWNENENVVLIGEKGGLTQRAYNTLLVVISAVKGEEAAAAYAKACPDVNSLENGEDFYVAVNEGLENYEFNIYTDGEYDYIKFTEFDDSENREAEVIEEESEELSEDIADIEDESNTGKTAIIIGVVVVIAIIAIVLFKKKKPQA